MSEGASSSLQRLDLLTSVADVLALGPRASFVKGNVPWWMLPIYPFVPRLLWPSKPILVEGGRFTIALGGGSGDAATCRQFHRRHLSRGFVPPVRLVGGARWDVCPGPRCPVAHEWFEWRPSTTRPVRVRRRFPAWLPSGGGRIFCLDGFDQTPGHPVRFELGSLWPSQPSPKAASIISSAGRGTIRILILATDIYTRGGIARYTYTFASALADLLGPENVHLLALLGGGDPSDLHPRFRVVRTRDGDD